MDKKKTEYIEEAGLLFEGFGMTRMAGRVFGYLTVCDKDVVSFDGIKKAVDASKGSISSTTKQLANAGLIEKVLLPGDRKTYFRVSITNVGSILKARIDQLMKFSTTLEKALVLKNREDEVSEWLIEMATFYNWVGDQINHIVDKWESEKEEIIKRRKNEIENEK